MKELISAGFALAAMASASLPAFSWVLDIPVYVQPPVVVAQLENVPPR